MSDELIRSLEDALKEVRKADREATSAGNDDLVTVIEYTRYLIHRCIRKTSEGALKTIGESDKIKEIIAKLKSKTTELKNIMEGNKTITAKLADAAQVLNALDKLLGQLNGLLK